MKPFKVPTCVCGHAVAEHGRASSGAGFGIQYGRCFKCDCPKFVEVDEKDEAA